jgi:DNA-binding SARP family transcriptional activator
VPERPGHTQTGTAVLPAAPPADPIRLTLLGSFRVELGDSTLVLSARGQRILAMLALLGPMSRAHAAGLLWPDASPRHAQGNLRTAVWRLRQVEPDLVEPWEEYLRLGRQVHVDIGGFTAWAMRLLHGGLVEPSDLGPTLPPAGDLLPGWADEWTLFERERLRQLRLHALEALARRLCDAGRFGAAVSAATEAIRLEPLRESAHHTLIAVHLAENNTAEAHRQYRTFHGILGRALGVEPSAHLRELVGLVA